MRVPSDYLCEGTMTCIPDFINLLIRQSFVFTCHCKVLCASHSSLFQIKVSFQISSPFAISFHVSPSTEIPVSFQNSQKTPPLSFSQSLSFPKEKKVRKKFWSSFLGQNIFLLTCNLFKFLADTLSPIFSVLFVFVGHAHAQDHGPVPDHAHAPSHAPSHDHALSRRCSSPIEVLIEVQLHRVFSEYSFCFGSEVVTYVLSFIFLLQSIVCIEDVGRENR